MWSATSCAPTADFWRGEAGGDIKELRDAPGLNNNVVNVVNVSKLTTKDLEKSVKFEDLPSRNKSLNIEEIRTK